MQAIDNPSEVLIDACLQPNFIDGRQEGFILKKVKNNGIYSNLGLQDGDVLLKINDYSITNPGSALQPFHAIRGLETIKVDIIRDGTRKTLTYINKWGLLYEKRVSMYQFIIAFLVANFLIIIFSSLSFPSTKEEIAKEQRIAFNFVNVELSAIANFISDIARKNLICDEHLKDKFTIITPSKLSLEDAFNLFTSVL